MNKEDLIEEVWKQFCYKSGANIDGLDYYFKKDLEFMIKENFIKAVSEIINTIWFDKDLQK